MSSLGVTVDVVALDGVLSGVAEALDRETAISMAVACDLVAERARSTHPYVDRTGALTASIQPAGVVGSFSRGDLEGRVGFGASSADGYPYGLAVEFGSKPHEILPRYRSTLRWPAGGAAGGFRFARKVNHPGTTPRPFMRPAVEAVMPEIEAEFAAAIEDAMRGDR